MAKEKSLELTYEEQLEELSAREQAVSLREKNVAERETTVSGLEEIKRDLERKYQQKSDELHKQEADILKDQTKELTKVKTDLTNARAELETVKKEVIVKKEELAAAKAGYDSELITYQDTKLQKIEEELTAKLEQGIKKIEQGYESFLKQTVSSVDWSNDKLQKAFGALNEEFKKMLESEIAIINQRKDDLEKAIKEYENALVENEKNEQNKASLELKDKQLARKEKMIDKLIEQEVTKQYDSICDDKKRIEDQLKQYKNKYNELCVKFDNLQAEQTSADNLDKNQLVAERERLLQKLDEYQKLYKEYSGEEYLEIKRKAGEYDAVSDSNRRLREENISLSNQIDLFSREKFMNDSLKHQNDMLELTIKTERQMMIQLQNELESLTARIDNVKSGVIASESIESPVEAFVQLPLRNDDELNENEWLQGIMNNCSESGFKFKKRLYYSFHTSLKTSDMSPLTVLAGVSGTGKSKLPQLYSKFGGLYFLSIPVKPDWDSPQSLFGYFNSIEKRFNATTLLRALVMFQADKSTSKTKDKISDLSDGVLLVLLDEMNLAHIEQYFSDLLSKLEERRGETENVTFEVDLGAQNDKYSIVLTDNVKWIGTMNEDETTKSLSDKVVDRGNVISFPRPTEFQRYNFNAPKVKPAEMMKKTVWEKWVKDKTELTEAEVIKYMDIVIGINNALKKVNRALGHRVWQSIENYMISHPLVAEYREEPHKKDIALTYAFEEALVHKVMPKLRGISTDGDERTSCLDVIERLLSDNDLSILPDFKQAMESVTGTFIWDSAMYLDDDYERLK